MPLTDNIFYLSILELLDKSIGSPLWIIMRNKKEFIGTLCGFDDFVSKKKIIESQLV
jgi:hypothetical protein